MSAFDEFNRKIEEFDSDEEKTRFIVEKLCMENYIDDPKEMIPVFIGYVKKPLIGSFIRVDTIKSAWNHPVSFNPFIKNGTGHLTAFYPSGSALQERESVVFTVKPGRRSAASELIEIDVIVPLSEYSLDYNSDAKDILNSIIRDPRFREYHYQIKALLDEKNAYEEVLSEIEKAEITLNTLNAEIEEKRTEQRKYQELEQKYPGGFSAQKERFEELLIQKNILENELDALKEEKETIIRAAEEAAEIEAKMKQYVPAGKTVQEVIAAIDEYAEHHNVIEHELELHRWLFGPRHTIDNSALSYEEMSSLEFLKNRLKYQYPDHTLVSFLMALSTNQIITLFGLPGTGKTTFVSVIAKALGAKCTVISVQNNWTDSSDLLGYFNPVHESYSSTRFIEALLEATNDFREKGKESRLHIICLDEMNLARVEYYFATFLSLLQLSETERTIGVLPEYIERQIPTTITEDISDNLKYLGRYRRFTLPPNVRFVGTINSDDTTNSLSPKVIDRSFFIELRREDYSMENDVGEINGYYPLSFFTPAPKTDDLPVFSGENGRFKRYARQMQAFYNDALKLTDDESFVDYMILGKILPAVTDPAQFLENDYYDEKFKLSRDRFDQHNTDNRYFNYLGGL